MTDTAARGRAGGGEGLATNAGLAAIGVVIAAVSLLWFAANAAGLLTGHGWPGIGWTTCGPALLRLLHRPGQPAAAFGAGARLPGPVGFYLVLGVLVVLVLGLATATAIVLAQRRRDRLPDHARWARTRDLAELAVPDHHGPPAGRIGLGYRGRQLLAAEPRHSVCVFGPTGSGKTLSVVTPALLSWTGPAVVTSVKTDVLDATEGWRDRQGPVFVYDPTRSTGRTCSTWTPLAGCSTWPGAWQVAGWLVQAAAIDAGGKHEAFWSSMSRKLLAPLLYAAGATGHDIADVLRWVNRHDHDEVAALLDQLGDTAAADAWHAAAQRDGTLKANAYGTVEAVLEAYEDPDVTATATGCQIDPDQLLDQHGTLYLIAPVHAQNRLRPLFEALIMSIVRAAQDRAAAGRHVDPGLLLMLDEAGNVAPLRDLPQIASTGRGQGIQVVSVWQDLAQIDDRYGRLATTVVNNHRAKLALSGLTDLGTLDYLSRLLGDTEADRISVTRQASGERSTSHSPQSQRLAPADILRQLPVGDAVLLYGALRPARVKLRQANSDRRYGRSITTTYAMVN